MQFLKNIKILRKINIVFYFIGDGTDSKKYIRYLSYDLTIEEMINDILIQIGIPIKYKED